MPRGLKSHCGGAGRWGGGGGCVKRDLTKGTDPTPVVWLQKHPAGRLGWLVRRTPSLRTLYAIVSCETLLASNLGSPKKRYPRIRCVQRLKHVSIRAAHMGGWTDA